MQVVEQTRYSGNVLVTEESLRSLIRNPALRYITCPKHGIPMRLIKVVTRDSEYVTQIVTFQCYAEDYDKQRGVCGMIVQVMDKDEFYLPGLLQSLENPQNTHGMDIPMPALVENPEETIVIEKFANPWNNNRSNRGIYHLIWEYLFDELIANQGYCDVQTLIDRVYEERKRKYGEKRAEKDLPVIRKEVQSCPRWVNWRTGYVIETYHSSYRVTGRRAGRDGWYHITDEGVWVPWGLKEDRGLPDLID